MPFSKMKTPFVRVDFRCIQSYRYEFPLIRLFRKNNYERIQTSPAEFIQLTATRFVDGPNQASFKSFAWSHAYEITGAYLKPSITQSGVTPFITVKCYLIQNSPNKSFPSTIEQTSLSLSSLPRKTGVRIRPIGSRFWKARKKREGGSKNISIVLKLASRHLPNPLLFPVPSLFLKLHNILRKKQ